MTRDDITSMARESGLWYKVGFPKEIERFAALIAAAEREQCAKACEAHGKTYDNEWNQNLGVAGELQEVASECAKAIRARE